jgi:tetratricopeptide (TPR) repeat protein
MRIQPSPAFHLCRGVELWQAARHGGIRETCLSVRDHIFISYRRDDARGASGRLYDWLRIAFGREHVFRDVDRIGAGKWRDKIDAALARSAACVAVIGPRWAKAPNLARLKDKDDLVRHELFTALASKGLTLVPTLVEGAVVPDRKVLPRELHGLLEWNALPVTEHGWDADTQRLIDHLASETGLRVGDDLGTLLAARQRLAELEQAANLQAGQIDSLQATIGDLTNKLAEASSIERPILAAALAALAKGDTRTAEDEFEREYESQRRAAKEPLSRGSDAARNVANLALLHDVTKAVAFYRKALELEPANAGTTRLLGNALVTSGDLQEARRMLSRSLQLALTQGGAWDEMAAQGDLARVAQSLGNLEEANTALARAVDISERQLAAEPTNTQWQRDLSVSHGRIGGVLVALGDGSGALVAYRKSLAIAEALAARDPANTEWQRDLSVSHEKIGDVLVAQGDGSGALATYRKSLAIAEALAARDPANTQWQRDLSVSYNKVGGVVVAQGDGSGALAAYRESLAIGEALAARDPANAQWQRDLSVNHNKIGDVLVGQGDGSGALAAYRTSLAISEALAARDPANTEWQRDLSVSHNKIGNALVAQGDGSGALAEYRKGLVIREALAARDPANAQWQRDLSVSHNDIGGVLVAQGDGPGALAAYAKDLAIAEALAARDPANTEWQRDLSISHERMGDVLVEQGDGSGALAAYRECLAIREVLAARDPANAEWQADLAKSCAKLGMMQDGESAEVRQDYLRKGRDILMALKASGRQVQNLDFMIDDLGKRLASPLAALEQGEDRRSPFQLFAAGAMMRVVLQLLRGCRDLIGRRTR